LGKRSGGGGGRGRSGLLGDGVCEVKGLRDVVAGENFRRKGLGGLASMTGHGYSEVREKRERERECEKI